MNAKRLFHVLGLMVLVGLAVVPAGAAQSRPGAQTNPSADSLQSTESSGSLLWNTFLGGSVDDSGFDSAFDASGNMYVCGGSAASWGTPVRPFGGGGDAYAAKLSPGGALVWNTFLGGNGSDSCGGIRLDGSGNVYIAGTSNASWGTPLQPYAGGDDAFGAKLNKNGVLLWNTFLGGDGGDFLDWGGGITVDPSGNMFIAGESTASWGTPIDPLPVGPWAIFVARLGPDGQLTWNTFIVGCLGRTWISGGMEVDANGNLYIGATSWSPFESAPEMPHEERYGFTVKLDASGAMLWSGPGGNGLTLDPAGNILAHENLIYPDDFSPYEIHVSKLGGDGNLLWELVLLGGDTLPSGSDIAADAAGNVYITGESYARWGAPLRPFMGITDAFLAKLNPDGNVLWNTFLGGPGTDSAGDLAVDASGNIFVIGSSSATWGAPRRPFAGAQDVFVAALANSGPLLWSTFLGGAGVDSGADMALDENSNLYVTATSGAAWGAPVRPYSGNNDAFLARLDANVPISGRGFRSLGAQDGWLLESAETSNAGGSLNSTAIAFRVGDDAADRQYRSILSFDTSALPDKIVITKATLWIRRYGMAGTNPFTTHGGLKVDVRKPYFGPLAGLAIGDFQAPASRMGAASFNKTPSAAGWHTAALNATVFPYINRTGTTQFRLRFQIDDNDDMAADYLLFHSGNALTITNRPRLAIQYYVP